MDFVIGLNLFKLFFKEYKSSVSLTVVESDLLNMELSVKDLPKEKIEESLLDIELREKILASIQEQGQVVVHIFCPPQAEAYAIRVWKTTFLVSRNSEHRSKLLHVDKISMAPEWLFINEQQPYSFTLIFEGLPKDVVLFDLVESIAQPGGFMYKSIPRNTQDVYSFRL